MFCAKLLIPSNDPQSFHLIEKEDYPHNNTPLNKIIPDFFLKQELSAHIAVICGGSEKWSADKFRNALAGACQAKDVVSFSMNKEEQPELTTVTKTYSVLININKDSPEEQTDISIEEIGRILRTIVNRLDTSSDDVNEDIIRVSGNLEAIKQCWIMRESNVAVTESYAKKITTLLDNLRHSNAIPQVMTLIFLPAEAFTYFDESNQNFPKQIEYVLKVEDTSVLIQKLNDKINALDNKVTELTVERDAAIAERDAAIAERDIAIAERDAIIAERDVKIAEKGALIERIKTENDDLKGILALFQMLSDGFFSREDIYAHEDYKHTIDIIPTPQLDKITSFFNKLLEDRAKYDPHYSEFILPLDNPPKLNEIKNTPVVTAEPATRMPVDAKGTEAKESPEIGDIQQEKSSIGESNTTYEDFYRDRR